MAYELSTTGRPCIFCTFAHSFGRGSLVNVRENHLWLVYFDDWNIKSDTLTLSPPNKLRSAKFLACLNFPSASMSLKVFENVVCVSNSLDPS